MCARVCVCVCVCVYIYIYIYVYRDLKSIFHITYLLVLLMLFKIFLNFNFQLLDANIKIQLIFCI